MTINITPSNVSILDLWQQSHAKVQAEESLKEEAKIGTLRGGSSGHISEDLKQVVGKCHRLAHLRSLGVQEKHGPETHLMFGAGLDNEEMWLKNLEKVWDGKILREDDVPVKLQLDSGAVVTGRPDIVLCTVDSVPVLGLELKLVSSVWTANAVNYKYEPKLPHLIQAAFYMMCLNIPYKLLYTSRVDWHVPYNLKNTLANRHNVVMQDNAKGQSEPFKIKPFLREYDLFFKDGVLHYDTLQLPCPQSTIITVDGIKRYYEIVSKIPETKNLGPRPAQVNALGTRASYSECSYCPLNSVCDTYDASGDYDFWLDQAKLVLNPDQQ